LHQVAAVGGDFMQLQGSVWALTLARAGRIQVLLRNAAIPKTTPANATKTKRHRIEH
jgi:hypothetical protein